MSNLPKVVPERLTKVYKDLNDTNFVKDAKGNKPVNLTEQDLYLIGKMLHYAQPQNPPEECYRKAVYFMYQKDKKGYITFLRKNNLLPLILWTDARTISQHFKLRGKIYLNWTGKFYTVSFHNNYGKQKQRSHPLAKPVDMNEVVESFKEIQPTETLDKKHVSENIPKNNTDKKYVPKNNTDKKQRTKSWADMNEEEDRVVMPKVKTDPKGRIIAE